MVRVEFESKGFNHLSVSGQNGIRVWLRDHADWFKEITGYELNWFRRIKTDSVKNGVGTRRYTIVYYVETVDDAEAVKFKLKWL